MSEPAPRPSSGSGPARARRGLWPWRRNAAPPPAQQREGELRRLALQLHVDLAVEGRGRCVLLVAPDDAELCVQPALDVAALMARELGRRVVLVDAAPAARALSAAFGAQAAPGLLDRLRDPGRPLAALLRPAGAEGLRLLPAGQGAAGALLSARSLGELLAELHRDCDDVLLLGPPLLADASGAALPALADGVLLFAAEGKSRLSELDAARAALQTCGARKVGLVLTLPEAGRGGPRA